MTEIQLFAQKKKLLATQIKCVKNVKLPVPCIHGYSNSNGSVTQQEFFNALMSPYYSLGIGT